MATEAAMDEGKMRAFTQKAVNDLSGTMAALMCAIGDRLGLFKDLAEVGPATSEELADRTGIMERYAREWLSALTCAGYLEFDPPTGKFTLPPEHAPVLAGEGGRVFLGSVYQTLLAMLGPVDQTIKAFREGGGVPQSAYDLSFWDGLERYSAIEFDHLLVQRWIPALPQVRSRLEAGGFVADVGCGSGRALIRLAQAYPNSRLTGFDSYQPNVAKATAAAQAAGVAGRVTFQRSDTVSGLPRKYDLITTFDVIQDAVDPLGLLRAVRQTLAEDGTYLILETSCSNRLEENTGPPGAINFGFSILYCMTSSLAGEGVGLGTMGLPASKLQELTAQAGFGSVNKIWENPFKTLYEVKP